MGFNVMLSALKIQVQIYHKYSLLCYFYTKYLSKRLVFNLFSLP